MENRALIIVPHQDDEINLIGNILNLITTNYETYVLYGSLDSSKSSGKIRKKEALQACNLWGIDEKHIIFLEYPDTSNAVGKHFYTSNDIMSKAIISDLKKYIFNIKPKIIFATDFDFHSDHRMLSLAFDKAMGEILNDDSQYTPIVYKGFCYETSFYGPEDYSASMVGNCVTYNEDRLSNASYIWNERISIQSDNKPGFIWNSKVFKGLKKHKSQYAILHARSIINSDNVFWIKRTDSLLRKASIIGSSGDVSKLNDFMIIDTDDIITINPRDISYEKALWKPQEDTCEISIEFTTPQNITELVIHGDPNKFSSIPLSIEILDENGLLNKISKINPYGRATRIVLNSSNTSKLMLKFKDYSSDFGLSEIELFNGEVNFGFNNDSNFELNYKKNAFLDFIDLFGYKFIVVITKIKRKINKILLDIKK